MDKDKEAQSFDKGVDNMSSNALAPEQIFLSEFEESLKEMKLMREEKIKSSISWRDFFQKIKDKDEDD